MKIERQAKRTATVEFEDASYTFAPDEHGRYVADVTNAKHAQRLLEIPGYSKPGERGTKTQRKTATPEPTPRIPASSTLPADVDDDEVTGKAFLDRVHGEDEEDGEGDDAGQDAEDQDGEGQDEGGQSEDVDGDGDVDRDDLVVLYEQKFGRKPHARLSVAKIREALNG